MATIDRIPAGRALPQDEWRVLYDWFAGWRWEHHRGGELVDESLASFETEEECRGHVQRRRGGKHATADRAALGESEDRARLAA